MAPAIFAALNLLGSRQQQQPVQLQGTTMQPPQQQQGSALALLGKIGGMFSGQQPAQQMTAEELLKKQQGI